MHPFGLGQEYRREALLEFVGSRQAQAGVIWGPREPGCLICTSGGRHGRKAGYSDGQQTDGSWTYVGQGTSGDQRLDNPANAKLASRSRSVLLFTTREPNTREVALQGYGKLYVFRGAFNVAGHEFFCPDEGPRKGDRILRFLLVPAEDGYAQSTVSLPAIEGSAFISLRKDLCEAAGTVTKQRIGIREYRARSDAVRRYATWRAMGTCECCGSRAPFLNEAGLPYLEVHHMTRLADDGPDSPWNVAAVCPNCHRALHLSVTRASLAASLHAKIMRLEDELASSGPGDDVVAQASTTPSSA